MYEVYADILFLVNLSMDYLCFFLTTKILHRKPRPLRMAIASALGALAAGRSSLGTGLLAAGTGVLALYAFATGFPGLLPVLAY